MYEASDPFAGSQLLAGYLFREIIFVMPPGVLGVNCFTVYYYDYNIIDSTQDKSIPTASKI